MKPIAAKRRGAAMVVALVIVGAVGLVSVGLMRALVHSHREARMATRQQQAHWLAESALARGAARLRADPAYAGETWLPPSSDPATPLGRAVIRVEGATDQAHKTIVVEAFVPDHPQRRARQSRELTIRLGFAEKNE